MTITRSWSRGDDAIDAVKSRLRRYRSLINRYNACQDLFDQLYPGCTPVYSDMPKGGGGLSRFDACIDKRWGLMEQMQDNLEEQQRQIAEVLVMVKELNNDEYAVITRRYMLGESVEKIAEEMNYGTRTIWRLHDKGVKHIAQKMA